MHFFWSKNKLCEYRDVKKQRYHRICIYLYTHAYIRNIKVMLCLMFLNMLFCSCDAEPTALAKYICALVRKDKPELELKALCNEQLDVFLQSSEYSMPYHLCIQSLLYLCHIILVGC